MRDFFRYVRGTTASKLVAILLCALLSACTTYEYHETVKVPINTLSEEQEIQLDEELFLDVGVVLFAHGVDESDDDALAYLNVRKSEAVWFTSQLKNTLDKSNSWGLVRALPSANSRLDLIVKGRLIQSDGERVILQIDAHDSGGNLWFSREYEQVASQYSYNPEVRWTDDPFQGLFTRIANDLFDHRESLSANQLRTIRATTKVLFAREFLPEAFGTYLVEDEQGIVSLVSIPSEDDPFMRKVDRIRSRNDLFLDVIQDYYRAFKSDMSSPYQEWRKLSYKEVLKERQVREQARKEKIAGVVAIAGGVVAARTSRNGATQVAGIAGSIYGANLFARSFIKSEQALAHSETLREMGSSLELALEPSVIDLQDRSVTLSGTVEDQFQDWRRILSRMFELEEGERIQPVEDSSE